jgi:hypothetical protein
VRADANDAPALLLAVFRSDEASGLRVNRAAAAVEGRETDRLPAIHLGTGSRDWGFGKDDPRVPAIDPRFRRISSKPARVWLDSIRGEFLKSAINSYHH